MDVDATTLTMSRLVAEDMISEKAATTGIVISVIPNTLMKAGIAWLLGIQQLSRRIMAASVSSQSLGSVGRDMSMHPVLELQWMETN